MRFFAAIAPLFVIANAALSIKMTLTAKRQQTAETPSHRRTRKVVTGILVALVILLIVAAIVALAAAVIQMSV